VSRRRSELRPVGTRTAQPGNPGIAGRGLASLGTFDLVGASGFDPAFPTPQIVLPAWIANALNAVA
jgi:hypothetical protein